MGGEVNRSLRAGISRITKERLLCPKQTLLIIRREGLRTSSRGRSSFPGGSPNPHNFSLPLAAQAFPPCLPCLPAFLQLAGCLLGAVAIETRPRRMLQDPGKRDALMCSLQQALCPNPHPERERKKYITLPLTWSSPWCLLCPALVKTCITLCLDCWISLLSYISASTEEGTEEHWIRSLT